MITYSITLLVYERSASSILLLQNKDNLIDLVLCLEAKSPRSTPPCFDTEPGLNQDYSYIWACYPRLISNKHLMYKNG